jgi:hypothetical protein
MAETAPVVALVRDLMFSSKISATGKALGTAVKIVRDPAKLAGETGTRLLVDLGQEGALAAAAAWLSGGGREAVGFVSHVDGATVAAAEAAGIRALPRSRFVQILPELLQSKEDKEQ